MKTIDRMVVQKIKMLCWLKINIQHKETERYKRNFAVYTKHNSKLKMLFNQNNSNMIKSTSNN